MKKAGFFFMPGYGGNGQLVFGSTASNYRAASVAESDELQGDEGSNCLDSVNGIDILLSDGESAVLCGDQDADGLMDEDGSDILIGDAVEAAGAVIDEDSLNAEGDDWRYDELGDDVLLKCCDADVMGSGEMGSGMRRIEDSWLAVFQTHDVIFSEEELHEIFLRGQAELWDEPFSNARTDHNL